MMPAALMIDLAALVWTAAMPQAGDCRTITDPEARLACYDAREAPAAVPAQPSAAGDPNPAPAPAYTPPAMATSVAPPANVPAPPSPAKMSTKAAVAAGPEGRVVAVTPMRYGLNRITLDDGRAFETTTNLEAPPPVGTAIRLRRTPLGTTFLDVPGRTPVTVRLARR